MARVTKLSIKGYRSVGHEIELVFPQNKPLVLVGENNGGKSNIIRALNQMLGQFSPHITIRKITSSSNETARTSSTWPSILTKTRRLQTSGPSCDGSTTIRRIVHHRLKAYGRDRQDYLASGDRETCSCMLIDAERNLKYQLSYSSKYTFSAA